MAVSVRMEPLLERQLELAAQRKGITKSQFIIDAVQGALGHKNPYELMQQVQSEHAVREPDAPSLLNAERPLSEQWGEQLRARQQAGRNDWEAFHAARRRGQVWSPDDDKKAGS